MFRQQHQTDVNDLIDGSPSTYRTYLWSFL